MSNEKGLKGFFRSIVGQTSEEDPISEEGKQGSERTATVEPAQRDEWLDDGGLLPELKGSLLQLWNKWDCDKGPPSLSLTRYLPKDKLTMDKKQLEREVLRITVLLVQDAKKRLREIQDAAERGTDSLNAVCHVYLSKDKMIAWLFIFPPVGPEGSLPLDGVGKTLQAAGVTTGIDTDAMLRIFQDKPYFDLIPIAVGTPAVNGIDGQIVEHYARELPLEIKIDENGMADYKYTNYVRQIMQGDVICDIIPPVQGRPGLRVDGKVVDPKKGRSARPPKGANTAVTEDGLHLAATIDGHLEFANQAFQVRPVLVVTGDVDYTVGNIEFTGNVHIRGDVRENFVVTATGSVTIDGLVEAATVEAGGDLIITRGVVGDNRALLKSGGCVRVKYLENCVVYAGKGVFADCIMNSQIFSDSTIVVTSGRGSVVGGALTAAQSIKAKMIGAQSGRRTELTLGVLPFVQNELQDIQNDIQSNRHEREELEKHLAYLENKQGLEGSDARLAKARMRKSVLEMKAQQLRKRQERLEPMLPDIAKCRFECDVVYPVTRLTVQEAVWVAKEVKRRCKVSYDVKQEELKESVF